MMVWLWEVKDGYLRWEKYGFIGGDGFSWRDGVTGSIATFGSYAFDKWLFPLIRRKVFALSGASPLNMSLVLVPDKYMHQLLFSIKIPLN